MREAELSDMSQMNKGRHKTMLQGPVTLSSSSSSAPR